MIMLHVLCCANIMFMQHNIFEAHIREK